MTEKDASNINILVVDDQAGMRQTLKGILGKKGFQVTTAEDGPRALEALRAGPFRIALVDVKMEGMSGVETLMRIKEIDPKIDVVMMTAFAVDEDIKTAMIQGAVTVLHKPFDIQMLMSVIDRSLEKNKADGTAAEPARETRLLIVDDDPSVGKTLQGILRKEGYRVDWVVSGQEAISRIRNSAEEDPVDVVLADMKLLDTDGLEVLRAIKETDSDIGAILMTGHSDAQTAVAALNHGAFAYILKPYDVDEVKATLKRFLDKQRLARENRTLLRRLQNANVDLENKVRVRTQDLQSANLNLANMVENMARLDRAKSQFVAMISHELRTPITIISGFVDLIQAQGAKLQKDALERYLHIIHHDCMRLTQLIADILEYSTMIEKTIEIKREKFDFREMLERVVSDLRPALQNGIKIETYFDEGIRDISSDKDRLQRVVSHLLGNAVKYSPSEAAVRLIAEDKGPDIQVSVIDAGPGIQEKDKDHVFDAFFRTQDPVNMRTPGMGLGLTISKATVEALGGAIWVESGIGQGSKFAFLLPRTEKQTPLPRRR